MKIDQHGRLIPPANVPGAGLDDGPIPEDEGEDQVAE